MTYVYVLIGLVAILAWIAVTMIYALFPVMLGGWWLLLLPITIPCALAFALVSGVPLIRASRRRT